MVKKGYSAQRPAKRSSGNATLTLGVLLVVLFVSIGLCCGGYSLVSKLLNRETPTPSPEQQALLTVAYSPEKELAFTALVDRFNEQGVTTPEGQRMVVQVTELDPEAMVNAVLDETASFQAMTPDSTLWLGQLDEAWNTKFGTDEQHAAVVGETVRYGISPVVIAMWEGVAREMGWPDRAISWQDLLTRAQGDANFRWSHPSTSSASGMLATLAMFYAGANKTRGLTIEDAQNQDTLDYVAALEKTVRYYGEGNEPALIERALQEGRAFLDAFVVQEQMVVYYNTHRGSEQERLVAVYPAEGVLWEDHPLALLETRDLTSAQRQTFASFRDFLLSSESQQFILRHGYRPADPSISLTGPDSLLTGDNGVDAGEPKTALQVPNAAVVKVVHDVWWYTKRHTNVYLVVDTSGSMRGEKLAQAQEALGIFLEQIKGDVERVGMVQFSSSVYNVIYLDELGDNRETLQTAIAGLEANGDTALLDAVSEAFTRLQNEGDSERINAIVAMTDGRENNSGISLNTLVRRIKRDSTVPVVIFCVAYGDDADLGMLQAIVEPSSGQVLQGDPQTIRDLYKILSTYF
jgi:Ca-activated chloride channel family protein